MKIFILILLIVFVFFFFLIIFKLSNSKKLILKAFNNTSCIVFGKKGCGKDLIFQYVINHRDEDYFSNITYGSKYHHIDFKDLDLNNTYINFINGNIVKTSKVVDREGKDIYFSDCGIYLPSQFDSSLHKQYPSLSVYYALSRHLYNSNIHCNTQALDRIWKVLREQADTFIRANYTLSLPGLLITSFTLYDKYQTALQGIESLKKPFFSSKQFKVLKADFDSKHGTITNGIIFIPKSKIKYNTRAFEEILFE